MKRIMIIGAPGSGKSTLARLLGEATGLPVYHMDKIHHMPGWVPRPMDQKLQMANKIEAKETWIFEGGLSSTFQSRSARADLLIHLDLPMLIRLWRVAKRIWHYHGQVRPDMADGCPEQISLEFIWYIISTARENRKRDCSIAANRPSGTAVTLTSQQQIDRWLAQVEQSGLPGAA